MGKGTSHEPGDEWVCVLAVDLYRGKVTANRSEVRKLKRELPEDRANPGRMWREIGEPEYLSALAVEQLENASRMVREPPWMEVRKPKRRS